MNDKLYRSRDGIIFGVCRGMANRYDLSAFWLRIVLVAIFFTTGFFPVVGLYIVAALIIKLEPAIEPATESEEEFYQSYAASGSLSLRRLKDKFEGMEGRIRRMEGYVTNKAYDWERRFQSGE